jgi:hypothetical protein
MQKSSFCLISFVLLFTPAAAWKNYFLHLRNFSPPLPVFTSLLIQSYSTFNNMVRINSLIQETPARSAESGCACCFKQQLRTRPEQDWPGFFEGR